MAHTYRNLGNLLTLLTVAGAWCATSLAGAGEQVHFVDDFEQGLAKWIVVGTVDVHDVGGEHGRVMRLRPNGDVHALVRGSDQWGNVAIEGELLFPEAGDSYLGVMYHYREHAGRSDFGLIYVKYGRRVYLQPNPHRDYNVTRTLYPEFAAPLDGASAVVAGRWQRFRVEIVDGVAHFYVGDFTIPALTFPIAEPGRGLLGLQPRSVGSDVWVDNLTVRAIMRHSYTGEQRPGVGSLPPHAPTRLWDVLGPLPRTNDAVVRFPDEHPWRPFLPDARGAIETARVVDYHGPNTVAYFRTSVSADVAGRATMRVSSVDDLAVWVNGEFNGFAPREDYAWFDVGRNAEHAGNPIPITLRRGVNTVVVRVRGGTYAAGGFFVRFERDGVELRPRAAGESE